MPFSILFSPQKHTFNTMNNKNIPQVHNFVDHKVVNFRIKVVSLQTKRLFFDMKKRAFIYGVAVDGNNFTDRVAETRRLKNDFENGQNVILISNRRIGKTSLVKHVCSQVDTDLVSVVNMDIYDCRSEYYFYNKFATSILKQTAQNRI